MTKIASSSNNTLPTKGKGRQLNPLASVFVPRYGSSQSADQVFSFNPSAPVFIPRSSISQSSLNPLAPPFVPDPNMSQSGGSQGSTLNPPTPVFTLASQDHYHHSDASSPGYANRELQKCMVQESSIDQIYTYEYMCSRGVPPSVARQRGLSHEQKMREIGRLRGARLDYEMARDKAERAGRLRGGGPPAWW
ncbi:hypothetical protein F4775DRAFT_594978 [Biscogniauxia sp. FL1348]|nr:hypothetical protein F4775DRAFT_594978 [Biscogniauxia sp. FL1348]